MKENIQIREEIFSGSENMQINDVLAKAAKQHDYPVIRPEQRVFGDVLVLACSAVLAAVVLFFVRYAVTTTTFAVICAAAVILWLAFFSKKLALTAIILYQKYAPHKIRSACLFTPCCSEYMKISITKYGVIRGIFKGTKRLTRCHYPNGGVDEP